MVLHFSISVLLISATNKVYFYILPTAVAEEGFLPPFVYVSRFFPHDISNIDAARITKFDIKMFHDESWKRIYFDVRR